MSDTTQITLPHRAVDAKTPAVERKTVATLLPDDCRWPFGDPTQPDFYFCGQKAEDGCTYCDQHKRLAFQPSKPRTMFYRPHAA